MATLCLNRPPDITCRLPLPFLSILTHVHLLPFVSLIVSLSSIPNLKGPISPLQPLMALRIATTVLLSLLLLSTSILTTTSSPMDSSWALSFTEPDSDNLLGGSASMPICNGKVGDCDGDTYEDVGTDLAAAVRRGLQWRKRYLSYDVLKKDRVPCNRRGHSYYNCQRSRQANPYRRGCSFITKCARIMNWWTTHTNKPCMHVHYYEGDYGRKCVRARMHVYLVCVKLRLTLIKCCSVFVFA